MTSWQQWEADRAAAKQALKAKPFYGGNRIGRAWLNAHNERTGRYIAAADGKPYTPPEERANELPDHIARFAKLI